MIIFIGGSKTVKSLSNEVALALDKIIAKQHEIIIGDCFGADLLAQKFLHKRCCNRVTVYASGDKVRNNYGNFHVKNISVPDGMTGFEFYRQKDIAMANDADCALMIWDGKSRGTLCNIRDMERLGKEVRVIRYE